MTHKEFYIWLDGFMTNREWTDIKEIDIEMTNEMKDKNTANMKIQFTVGNQIDLQQIRSRKCFLNLYKELHALLLKTIL